MTEVYLHRVANNVWDKVDEYVYKNQKYAVEKDGSQRYNGNSIVVNSDGTIKITGTLQPASWGNVFRFLGIKEFQGSVPGGFVQEPNFVKMKKGNVVSLHEVGGDTFRKAA